MFKKSLWKKAVISGLAVSLMLTMTACGTPNQPAGTSKVESDYPNKPITVLQGFAAGGGSDQLAMLTGPYLQKELGNTLVNQYIPGATGAIAWTQLTKQTAADGYTLSITNTPMLMTNYLMNTEIKYTIDELTPIANVVTDPGILVVSKDSPFKTYQDYINYVKANPGQLTIANSGTGGDDFFTILQWQKATGLSVKMIPFTGDGPSWQAAAGNKVQASSTNLGVVYSQVKAGNLRALAIYSEKRSDLLPDVPTAKELGVDLVAGSSRGYSAPKGIPENAKKKLIDSFTAIAKDPAFLKGLQDAALPIDLKVGDEYAKYLKDQETEFKSIWDSVNDTIQK
ncbi:tripartite tricarboxylate transporter substrate binding protein [Desulfosporosinus shakirovi]|uniref:tripartite tricarboxylate transporter substrate binding protein n=1 Tax=Desulfosporosinus shakirovi TaxID=2885154 RepID=UPI001E44803A|nr:tripartite tricarboxylate transporter substrate binding protein [Desulfosporosinus sp. SRJS8]MCB8815155.1 tripartite tricarboxylate transporter substrate binding protein [Desulfosporosinus sp. SRJS8]